MTSWSTITATNDMDLETHSSDAETGHASCQVLLSLRDTTSGPTGRICGQKLHHKNNKENSNCTFPLRYILFRRDTYFVESCCIANRLQQHGAVQHLGVLSVNRLSTSCNLDFNRLVPEYCIHFAVLAVFVCFSSSLAVTDARLSIFHPTTWKAA